MATWLKFCLFLAITQLAYSSAAGEYYYFRADNFDAALPLTTNVTWSSISSSRAVTWNTTYRNFDSERDVHVTRFDLFLQNTDLALSVRLGGADGLLQLPQGPAYLFSTADTLTVEDVVSGAAATATAQDAVWLSGGSCVRLDVSTWDAPPNRNMSVLLVSSGEIDPSLSGHEVKGCNQSAMRVGTADLHNNPVDYVSSGSCADPLKGPGGANDFDDMDAPIRPLASHYHTRSTIYYVSRGAADFNESVEGPMTSGDLRFVTAGHFYGPETMWEDDQYVLSLHEADPAKRSTGPSNPPDGFVPCPFACLDEPKGDAFLRCVVNATSP